MNSDTQIAENVIKSIDGSFTLEHGECAFLTESNFQCNIQLSGNVLKFSVTICNLESCEDNELYRQVLYLNNDSSKLRGSILSIEPADENLMLQYKEDIWAHSEEELSYIWPNMMEVAKLLHDELVCSEIYSITQSNPKEIKISNMFS